MVFFPVGQLVVLEMPSIWGELIRFRMISLYLAEFCRKNVANNIIYIFFYIW